MSEKKNWTVWVSEYPDEGANVYEYCTQEQAMTLASADFGTPKNELSIKEATEDKVEASHAEP